MVRTNLCSDHLDSTLYLHTMFKIGLQVIFSQLNFFISFKHFLDICFALYFYSAIYKSPSSTVFKKQKVHDPNTSLNHKVLVVTPKQGGSISNPECSSIQISSHPLHSSVSRWLVCRVLKNAKTTTVREANNKKRRIKYRNMQMRVISI